MVQLYLCTGLWCFTVRPKIFRSSMQSWKFLKSEESWPEPWRDVRDRQKPSCPSRVRVPCQNFFDFCKFSTLHFTIVLKNYLIQLHRNNTLLKLAVGGPFLLPTLSYYWATIIIIIYNVPCMLCILIWYGNCEPDTVIPLLCMKYESSRIKRDIYRHIPIKLQIYNSWNT